MFAGGVGDAVEVGAGLVAEGAEGVGVEDAPVGVGQGDHAPGEVVGERPCPTMDGVVGQASGAVVVVEIGAGGGGVGDEADAGGVGVGGGVGGGAGGGDGDEAGAVADGVVGEGFGGAVGIGGGDELVAVAVGEADGQARHFHGFSSASSIS